MSDYPIISTALNVPTVAPRPSINCLQWSGDGQVVLTTKTAIYLLTPDSGINFDTSSIVKASVEKGGTSAKERDDSIILGWFRTLIELDKVVQHQWPLDTPEWGAVSLGSLDVAWRAATISPSNLTARAGCLLVSMSSNMELALWCATKNHLKGEWGKIQDITANLKALPLARHYPNSSHEHVAYLRTLQAQVNYMAWSSQADFGLTPNPLLDASFLALGNRAGSVLYMRYDGDKNVKHVQTVRITDDWVVQVAWSSWRIIGPGRCQAYLACGISDGSIVLVKVCQGLEQMPSSTPFGGEYKIHADFEVLDLKPSEADERGITGLCCVDTSNERLIVIHAKPGMLKLWRMPSDADPQGGSWTLRLRTQKISVGSSSLTSVVGISYVQHRDALVVTLFDGSFHVVYNISSEPTLDDDIMDIDDTKVPSFTSAELSYAARAAFVRAEGGGIQKIDVNRTSGSMSFDNANTVAWLHEACRPTDFSYKSDAMHNSVLVVAQIWECPGRTQIVEDLQKLFTMTTTATSDAPIHVLRGIFTRLRDPKELEALKPDIVRVLLYGLPEDPSEGTISSWEGEINQETRASFRRSVARHLYGFNSLQSLRLRLATADFCWKSALTEETRSEFGQNGQVLLTSISHRILQVLVKHIAAITSILTANDIPFVQRVIAQSLLPGTPPDLSAEANELSVAVGTMSAALPGTFDLRERCPACDGEVPLDNITEAACLRGHVWKRCSITSLLLSTPMVRTCIGCTRKALLPPTQRPSDSGPALAWLPEVGRSWVVEELLEAARCCLYCGNRFVRIL